MTSNVFKQQPETNECAHPECLARVRTDTYACPAHWFSLPPLMRIGIQHAFKKRFSSEYAFQTREAQNFWASQIRLSKSNLPAALESRAI